MAALLAWVFGPHLSSRLVFGWILLALVAEVVVGCRTPPVCRVTTAVLPLYTQRSSLARLFPWASLLAMRKEQRKRDCAWFQSPWKRVVALHRNDRSQSGGIEPRNIG